MALDPITAITDLIKTGLDKWIPDANAREKAASELAQSLLEEKKLDIQDRDSARHREMEVKDRTPAHLAYATVGGFLSMTCGLIVTALLGYTIDSAAMGLIGTLVGYLSAKSEQVLSYYFGSSSGSDKKTELLGKK